MKLLLAALCFAGAAANADVTTEAAPYQPFAKMSGFKLLVEKPGNPLVKAGAKKNDVVTSVNGKKIESQNDAKWAFEQAEVTELTVLRDGKPFVIRPKGAKHDRQ